MNKNRVLIAVFLIFCFMGVTGAWALTESRDVTRAGTLFSKINSACDNPDAACAALLNQLEPGA